MLIKSTILKLQKSFLYNFGVEDKIWLNSAAILVVKGAGDGALFSGPGLTLDSNMPYMWKVRVHGNISVNIKYLVVV